MKKVLVFIDWYLPAYKAGGPISSVCNMTESLSDEMSFFIVTGNKDLNSNQPLKVLKSNIWQKVKNGLLFWRKAKKKPAIFELYFV